jgi:hypothetical protein
MNELFATLSSFPLILLLFALVIDVIQTLEIITQDARSLLPVAKSRLASELDIVTVSSSERVIDDLFRSIVFDILLLHVIWHFDHVRFFG